MEQATTESEQVVATYYEMWNEQDRSRIPDVVSESFVLREPAAPEHELPGPAGEVHGPDGLAQYMAAVVRAFPDHHFVINEMVASEGVVMVEDTVTATHEGELFGLPPTGREITLNEVQKYRVEDGKVQTHVAYYNEQEVKEQLGLTVPEVVWQLPTLIRAKLR